MAAFRGSTGADNLVGADGAKDRFLFRTTEIAAGDTVVGGDGPQIDTLHFRVPGVVSAAALAGVSGIETIDLIDGGVALELTSAVRAANGGDRLTIIASDVGNAVDASAVGGGALYFRGGAGDDVFTGGGGDDVIRTGGGSDAISGGAGRDVVIFGGLFENYTVTHQSGVGFTIDDGLGNITTVSADIEVLRFDDRVFNAFRPPQPPSNLAVTTDTGGSSADLITMDQTLVISGTASLGDTVEVFLNGNLIGVAAADVGGNWSLDYTGTTLAPGAYQLGAVTTNEIGLKSFQINRTLTIDLTPPVPPTVQLNLSSDSGVVGDRITTDLAPTLQGSVNGASHIQVYKGATLVGETAVFTTSWSIETSALGLGEHELTVFALDAAGNMSAPTTFTVTIVPNTASKFDLDNLSPDDGFRFAGGGSLRAGAFLDGARDVNGDGVSDILIAAPGTVFGGRAVYAIFGTSEGFGDVVAGERVLSAATLTSDRGFTMVGEPYFVEFTPGPGGGFTDIAGDAFAASASFAGDINGDGLDDIIVGAPGFIDGFPSQTYEFNRAYVFYGSRDGFGVESGGRQTIALPDLPPEDGLVLRNAGGYAMAALGDVNGDGFGDMIVANPFLGAGDSSVIFGSPDGLGSLVGSQQVFDVANLAPSQGFMLRGDATGDQSGVFVSSAGDVNGDGIADIIVSANQGDDGGSNAGEAYVVFGTTTGFGAISGGRAILDVTNLGGAAGFIIQGDTASDGLGSISSAGDVNGDGYDDLIVGAAQGDDGGLNAGEAYVIFGKAGFFGVPVSGRRVIDLTTLSASQGFVIQGADAGDNAGNSVSGAGDINGDGFADLLVGAPGGDEGGPDAGEVYVIYGTDAGFGAADGGRHVLDLGTLAEPEGFVIQGDAQNNRASRASEAGDVNADGFDDILIGAPDAFPSSGGGSGGAAYVIFGGLFGGSNVAEILTGDASGNILIGGAGADIIKGQGGADVLRGGAGNDRLSVKDATFRDIDGGHGVDTLLISAANVTLDLSAIGGERLQSIERFNLTGTGDNHLIASVNDIAAISGAEDYNFAAASSARSFVVIGDAGDSLALTPGAYSSGNWMLVENDVGLNGAAGGSYDIYDFVRNGSALATVAVHIDVSLILA